MSLRRPAWTGMLLSLMATAAVAQTPPPPAEDDPMARARRQAENPMRRILEAGRITVRRPAAAAAEGPVGPAAAELAAEPARPPGVSTTTGVRPAGAASLPPLPDIRVSVEPIAPPVDAARPAAADIAAPVREVPVAPAAPPEAQPSVAPSPAEPPVPPTTTAADRVPERRPPMLPPLPVPPSPQADATAPTTPGAAPGPATPRLRTLVEPALTPRLRDELGRVDVVAVDLQLGADGSVQDAQVVTRVPAAVRRSIVAALRQWRYEPLPEPVWLRVEVAFER